MSETQTRLRGGTRALVWALCIIIFLGAMGYLAYNLTFWYRAYRIDRTYGEGGSKQPVVEAFTLSDGRPAHAITFFGTDGDSVFINETRTISLFSGGVARVEMPDCEWFVYDPNEILEVNISLSPVLITAAGEKTALPIINLDIATPASPISISKPENDYLSVNTSVYTIQASVYPGSTVSVNGADISGQIDRNGEFETTVNVEAKGDNAVSLIVQTPYHKETRKDIVLYRQAMEIDLELAVDTVTKTSLSELKISGKTEPGASVEVDTAHVYNSIKLDSATGDFSFVAQFSTYGENTVRFRAKREGLADSVISFQVNYTPSIAEYSSKAWAMTYADLVKFYETWKGRVFLCTGPVREIIVDGTTQYLIMDVSKGDEQQLIALENVSSLDSVRAGTAYKAWADVNGRYFYNDAYIPMLVARYMDTLD